MTAILKLIKINFNSMHKSHSAIKSFFPSSINSISVKERTKKTYFNTFCHPLKITTLGTIPLKTKNCQALILIYIPKHPNLIDKCMQRFKINCV